MQRYPFLKLVNDTNIKKVLVNTIIHRVGFSRHRQQYPFLKFGYDLIESIRLSTVLVSVGTSNGIPI